jgi:hypothetical protein
LIESRTETIYKTSIRSGAKKLRYFRELKEFDLEELI